MSFQTSNHSNQKDISFKNKDDLQFLLHILKKNVRSDQEIQILEEGFKEVEFFKSLKNELQADLIYKLFKNIRIEKYQKRQLLYYEGDHENKFNFVISGKFHQYRFKRSQNQPQNLINNIPNNSPTNNKVNNDTNKGLQTLPNENIGQKNKLAQENNQEFEFKVETQLRQKIVEQMAKKQQVKEEKFIFNYSKSKDEEKSKNQNLRRNTFNNMLESLQSNHQQQKIEKNPINNELLAHYLKGNLKNNYQLTELFQLKGEITSQDTIKKLQNTVTTNNSDKNQKKNKQQSSRYKSSVRESKYSQNNSGKNSSQNTPILPIIKNKQSNKQEKQKQQQNLGDQKNKDLLNQSQQIHDNPNSEEQLRDQHSKRDIDINFDEDNYQNSQYQDNNEEEEEKNDQDEKDEFQEDYIIDNDYSQGFRDEEQQNQDNSEQQNFENIQEQHKIVTLNNNNVQTYNNDVFQQKRSKWKDSIKKQQDDSKAPIKNIDKLSTPLSFNAILNLNSPQINNTPSIYRNFNQQQNYQQNNHINNYKNNAQDENLIKIQEIINYKIKKTQFLNRFLKSTKESKISEKEIFEDLYKEDSFSEDDEKFINNNKDILGDNFYNDELFLQQFFSQCYLIKIIKPGEQFGEIAQKYRIKSPYTCICLEEGWIGYLNRKSFDEILLAHNTNKLTQNLEFLQKLSIFEGLNQSEIEQIYNIFSIKEYSVGEYIYKEQDEDKCIYIIRNGLIEIAQSESGMAYQKKFDFEYLRQIQKPKRYKLAKLGEGEIFGDYEILEQTFKRSFCAKCVSHNALLYVVEKEKINMLLEIKAFSKNIVNSRNKKKVWREKRVKTMKQAKEKQEKIANLLIRAKQQNKTKTQKKYLHHHSLPNLDEEDEEIEELNSSIEANKNKKTENNEKSLEDLYNEYQQTKFEKVFEPQKTFSKSISPLQSQILQEKLDQIGRIPSIKFITHQSHESSILANGRQLKKKPTQSKQKQQFKGVKFSSMDSNNSIQYQREIQTYIQESSKDIQDHIANYQKQTISTNTKSLQLSPTHNQNSNQETQNRELQTLSQITIQPEETQIKKQHLPQLTIFNEFYNKKQQTNNLRILINENERKTYQNDNSNTQYKNSPKSVKNKQELQTFSFNNISLDFNNKTNYQIGKQFKLQSLTARNQGGKNPNKSVDFAQIQTHQENITNFTNFTKRKNEESSNSVFITNSPSNFEQQNSLEKYNNNCENLTSIQFKNQLQKQQNKMRVTSYYIEPDQKVKEDLNFQDKILHYPKRQIKLVSTNYSRVNKNGKIKNINQSFEQTRTPSLELFDEKIAQIQEKRQTIRKNYNKNEFQQNSYLKGNKLDQQDKDDLLQLYFDFLDGLNHQTLMNKDEHRAEKIRFKTHNAQIIQSRAHKLMQPLKLKHQSIQKQKYYFQIQQDLLDQTNLNVKGINTSNSNVENFQQKSRKQMHDAQVQDNLRVLEAQLNFYNLY